jgi:predicted O-linked N-acetylglucosamine transferase (SPINDLY family)
MGASFAYGTENAYMVTSTVDGYVRAAIHIAACATNEVRLPDRSSVRRMLQRSPFMDYTRLAAQIEGWYLGLFDVWARESA